MGEAVWNCPRCSAQDITLDVRADIFLSVSYEWMTHHELFLVCRRCHRGSIAKADLVIELSRASREYRRDGVATAYLGAVNDFLRLGSPVSIRDVISEPAPEATPTEIAAIFVEGSSSIAASCYNAAAAMFRLSLDLATKSLLPAVGEQVANPPNRDQRNKLYNRLEWLFDNARLPRDLAELATCVREDGNDGAHDGTLTQADAEDLLDFARAILERAFTEPARLAEARERRVRRRNPES